MQSKNTELPSQKELEKELNEYLARKYGHRVRVISAPLLEPKQTAQGGKSATERILSKINFDLKPEELIAYLDQYVIKQEAAKAIIATKICTHFNRIKYWLRQRRNTWQRVNYIKNNILMIGPTGVGKTFIIKLIAQKLGVPFVKGDATKFSETGYVGGDVEDLVRELVHQANDDIELAQFGIIYIDEIDKIASSGNMIGPDVSRTGVQRALLKPMEETEIDLKTPYDPISQLEAIEHYRRTGKREQRVINTRHVLFIMSGAFSNLEEIIKQRLHRQGIGFGAEVSSKNQAKNYLPYVKAEDLIKYGFESEFIGRLPVIAVFEHLETEDLYQILKNPNSVVINAKKHDFRAYGIDIVFEDEALRLLAEKAAEEGTGARGLVSVLEKALMPFEKTLPSTGIKKLVITKEVVLNPYQTLKKLLDNKLDISSEERFQQAEAAQKEYLCHVITSKGETLAKQHNLILTPRRIALIVNAYDHFECDLSFALQELAELTREIDVFLQAFHKETGLRCRFSEEAIDEILEKAVLQDKDIMTICHQIAQNLEFGLKLIRERMGDIEFEITIEALREPEVYIRDLIQKTYKDE
ncbi:MAG: AAA family ATPase [Candidatus Desulfofervidaceae bacterium]|nr:AAA family ATPase [Candidatus Desulfofervidaceae bacterium]MDL1969415.1 AAA family ATPase [Candidatus Desulfofervidaceae bacterium]